MVQYVAVLVIFFACFYQSTLCNRSSQPEMLEEPTHESPSEPKSSMKIFFALSLLASSIILVHILMEFHFHYIPESLAVVFLGASVGLIGKLFSKNLGEWEREETMNPTTFFLVILPPIIYDSGYTLHKGNFFQNIGTILVFAIIGTAISAFILGGGIYLLGVSHNVFELQFAESFAFGSLISAVDPVATLAIFSALDLDPILHMLVFGESVLNDAVSIVLAQTALEFNKSSMEMSATTALFKGVTRFIAVFVGSSIIGVVFALIAAIIFKCIKLHRHPALEYGMMMIFIYAPYSLAEGLQLSGIMAILFNGVVMSHYAHYNLSPITQITIQQTLRTLAFICETLIFAYLGLAIFSFQMVIQMSFIIWSVVLCLVGRALNIYPLSMVVNLFREHKISCEMMFIMWFSGLRGAIAYALALHLAFDKEKKKVIVTTTLIIVLFTTIAFGGSTMPILKVIEKRKKARKPNEMNKTDTCNLKERAKVLRNNFLGELNKDEWEFNYRHSTNLKGFLYYDAKYFMPLFTRCLSEEEAIDWRAKMINLTNRWYQQVRRYVVDDSLDVSLQENNTTANKNTISLSSMKEVCVGGNMESSSSSSSNRQVSVSPTCTMKALKKEASEDMSKVRIGNFKSKD